MGKLHLLKASYTGSVGEQTGAKLRSTNVIKQKIWSKAPPSPLQKKNVRAYETICRIAGVLARKWWKYLGLKQGNMLKHNAVARWLKPTIKNHVFDASAMDLVTHFDNSIIKKVFDIDGETGKLSLDLTLNRSMITGEDISWCILVCDGAGRTIFFIVPDSDEFKAEMTIPFLNYPPFYLFAWCSRLVDGKRVITCTAHYGYYAQGVILLDIVPNQEWYYAGDGIIATDSNIPTYEDGIINLNINE